MATQGLQLNERSGHHHGNDDKDDHCHGNKRSDDQEIRKARRQLLIASVLCCIFMIAEVIGGALAHSLAIMSDAAHLLTDFASFAISLFAMYLTRKQRTKKLSFGWYRAEILGALISILFLWILTGVLVYMGIQRILHPNYTINATIMLITASFGVVINVVLGLTLHQHGHQHSHGGGGSSSSSSVHESDSDPELGEGATRKKKLLDDKEQLIQYGTMDKNGQESHEKSDSDHEHGHSHNKEKNINVRAAFVHVLGDLVQSFGVLIAAIIIYFKPEWKIADPLCTFLFSILVFFTTMSIVKDIVHVLMEGAPRTVDFVEVMRSLFDIPGVRDVHDLRMWSLSMNKVAMAVHLAVEKGSDPMKVLKQSSDMVKARFGISETVIQVEEFHPNMVDCHECKDPPD